MECNICLHVISDEFVYTKCKCKNTVFHKKCLDKWLKISRTCPFCKCKFRSIPKKYTNEKSELDKALIMDSMNRYPSIYYHNYINDNYTETYSIPPYL